MIAPNMALNNKIYTASEDQSGWAFERNRLSSKLSKSFRRKRNGQFRWSGYINGDRLLLFCTLIAVVGGSFAGLALNPMLGIRKTYLDPRERAFLKFPGEIFMRMLRMLIIPMVMSSNICSIAALNSRSARMMAVLSMIYYVSTTVLAASIGLLMVSAIRPGDVTNVTRAKFGIDSIQWSEEDSSVRLVDSLMDFIRNMIPQNLVRAAFEKTQTVFRPSVKDNPTTTAPPPTQQPVEDPLNDDSSSSAPAFLLEQTIENETIVPLQMGGLEARFDFYAKGTNILGLITFSIFFGFALNSLGSDAQVLVDMIIAVRKVCIYMVSVVMWVSPIGIMFLIAEDIAGIDHLDENLNMLSKYVITVMTALGIHALFVLPGLLYFIAKRNPFQFAHSMLQALMCSMGTASSTASLPCTIKCLEGRNQVDPRVVRFMLPLGTTINMDGTALYQAVASVFIAQVIGKDLDLAHIILIGVTSSLASMAAASMPSAGLVTISMVLTSVGLPDQPIMLLFPVDWFLDRFRTMTNVFSDSVGVAIVSKLCEHRLNKETSGLEDKCFAPNAGGDAGGGTGGRTGGGTGGGRRSDSQSEASLLNNVECGKKWNRGYRLYGSPKSFAFSERDHPVINDHEACKQSFLMEDNLMTLDGLHPENRRESYRGRLYESCVYITEDKTVVLKF